MKQALMPLKKIEYMSLMTCRKVLVTLLCVLQILVLKVYAEDAVWLTSGEQLGLTNVKITSNRWLVQMTNELRQCNIYNTLPHNVLSFRRKRKTDWSYLI